MTAADTSVRPTAAANWRALGTSVRLVTTDPALLDSCNLLLARQLAEVDAACSRFREDSELVALDRADGRPVRVSPLLAEALAVALRAAAATDGAVDPTVGSAMNAIGYDRDFRLVQEEGRPVKLTVRPVPGWRLIRLDRATGTVTVPAGVRLDLGATAKAWAADKAAVTLARVAGCGVLVSLGGDTAVAGEPRPVAGGSGSRTSRARSTRRPRRARTRRSACAAAGSPPPARPPAPGARARTPSTTSSTRTPAFRRIPPGVRSRSPPPPAPTRTRPARLPSSRAQVRSAGCRAWASRHGWWPGTARW